MYSNLSILRHKSYEQTRFNNMRLSAQYGIVWFSIENNFMEETAFVRYK